MKLEEFKDLIFVTDYKMCESKIDKNPTMYLFTLDVFVKFLYKIIFLFLCLCVFLLCFVICLHSFVFVFIESYPTQPTSQQGCTAWLHPSRSDPLMKFGILLQKSKIDSSKIFGFEISKWGLRALWSFSHSATPFGPLHTPLCVFRHWLVFHSALGFLQQ